MRRYAAKLSTIVSLMFLASTAQAYIGPGAGLSAIGSALALIGALLLMIVGFIWYPVKRLMRRRKETAPSPSSRNVMKPGQTDDKRDRARAARESDAAS